MRTLITKYQSFPLKMAFHGLAHSTQRVNPYLYIDGNRYDQRNVIVLQVEPKLILFQIHYEQSCFFNL